MESSGLEENFVASYDDWKIKASALEEKITALEKEEQVLEVEFMIKKLYSDIHETVFIQACFYVPLFWICLVALFVKNVVIVRMDLFIVSVMFSFLIGVVCPLVFAYRLVSRLRFISKKLIYKREKIFQNCLSLREEYNQIYAIQLMSGDNDDLLKAISSFPIQKFVNFKRGIPKFRKKHNLLMIVVGVCLLLACAAYLQQ